MTDHTRITRKDDSSIERRIRFLELSIVTITAVLAIYTLNQNIGLIISLLILISAMIELLFSFILDDFVEIEEIQDK